MTEFTKTVLKEMTTEEKARLLKGVSTFTASGVPRLSIPEFKVLDGATGINFEQLFGDMFAGWRAHPADEDEAALMNRVGCKEERNVIFNYFAPDALNADEKLLHAKVKAELKRRHLRNTTNSAAALAMANGNDDLLTPACFPAGMMLAATFNPDRVNDVGHALGREARAFGINLLLGTPNVNIHRDPLNGRLFEGFSEDPCLVAKLAPELAKGVEAEGVASNIKHFAANNQEKNRQGIDETIPVRALEEIYLPGFKACVKEAKPASVMSAYNKINGVPCTENMWLLTDVLRGDWGFNSVVISDWGAITNEVKAVLAGNDLNMPGPADVQEILDALEDENSGFTMADLDRAAGRILDVILKYGAPERYEYSAEYIAETSKKAAYKAAVEGVVMLKNEGNMFPLKGKSASIVSDSAFGDDLSGAYVTKADQVVLLGSGAIKLAQCGSGSAGVTTNKHSSIYSGLAKNGIDVSLGMPMPAERANKDIYILVATVSGQEGNDRPNMDLSLADATLLDQMVEVKKMNPAVKLGLILNVCGPVDISKWDDALDGIFCMFLPGMEGGNAMADILVGRANPSGKLPLTFPRRYLDTPTCLNFPGDGYHVNYGEGIYVGYRYYEKKDVKPLYPFGHGLSYSMFSLFNARAKSESKLVEIIHKDGTTESKNLPVFTDKIKIAVDVASVGPDTFAQGKETIQLYVQDPESTITKPVKELKTFAKVKLAPGEKTTATFTLTVDDFASYDTDLGKWIAEQGVYNLLIGTSSTNIFAQVQVYLDCANEYGYSVNSPLKDLYENRVIRSHLESICNQSALTMSDVETVYQYVPNTTFAEVAKDKVSQEMLMKFDNVLGRLKKA